jgi:hypothetical protein
MEKPMADNEQRPRERVSARLDPGVIEIVESVAQGERRPVPALVRNIVSDWAAIHTLPASRNHQPAAG